MADLGLEGGSRRNSRLDERSVDTDDQQPSHKRRRRTRQPRATDTNTIPDPNLAAIRTPLADPVATGTPATILADIQTPPDDSLPVAPVPQPGLCASLRLNLSLLTYTYSSTT